MRDGLSLLDQAIAQGGEDGDATIRADRVADMLGLADRGLVFDLLDAVMAGRPAAALAITDQAHERGADLGLMLADLLELIHTVSRLKAVPGLRDSRELPEAERVRGAALADALSVPILGRAWQMLLKGVAEVETAPDRREAAEMVLIRLCHVADLPLPGDLVRQLQGQPQRPVAAPASSEAMIPAMPPVATAPEPVQAGSASLRSVTGGALRAATVPEPAPAPPDPAPPPLVAVEPPPPPSLRSWREVVAFVATRGEPILHGHLRHCAHLVRFAAPVIELRLEPQAPRDLSQRLARILSDATGTRWTIALGRDAGEPTIAEQAGALDADRSRSAETHPLVQAILAAFPGARLGPVSDATLDEYGLPPEPAVPAPLDAGSEPPEMEFAPLDSEPVGLDDLEGEVGRSDP